MRRRYRQLPDNTLVEITKDTPKTFRHDYHIQPDIEPFISPIDLKPINGRRQLREHNKIHDVVNAREMESEWEAKRKEREKYFTPTGRRGDPDRIEAIKQAMSKHGYKW